MAVQGEGSKGPLERQTRDYGANAPAVAFVGRKVSLRARATQGVVLRCVRHACETSNKAR